MDVMEKLEVIAHLDDHITYKEDIGICYDSALAKVIEDAYMELKNGVTVQEDCKDCAKATQNCIVKLQEQIAELRSAQEWISVKDRLPEPGDYVLVCDIREDWYGLWEFSGSAWYDASYQPWSIDEVTHWQYLPKPPKGE